MQKTLDQFWNNSLAERANFIERHGGGNPLVTGLEYDSRKVKKNNLYFALPGLHTDGHNFITNVIKEGASVIVHQNELTEYKDGIVYLRVRDSRYAMSAIAAGYYDNPCEHLTVIGVTGTEGKSTTVYLIFQLLRSAGKKCGFISTVQFSTDGGEQWNSEHQTTPEATQIHKLLSAMVDNACEYAVIESSSHGLSVKTNRLGDVIFDVAVMTNVTHEHLEFHGTWEQYRDDKANLFRALDKSKNRKSKKESPVFGVVNADDKNAAFFAACTKHKTITHSAAGADADFSILRITSRAQGNAYDVKCPADETLHIEDNLPGAFNAGNVLAAVITVSRLLKIPPAEFLPLVQKLKPVRGRMTPVCCGQNFEVIVDYAHTPSSFQTIFPPLRERLDGGRIISVLGSAGERDTQKRPQQGEIAARILVG
ncbi:hypothetical protein FACS1894190_08970 [Spirochaetia bacterium]|nr:hypothetical protein FACS1894190_08970 [Spirochaetia bacterium]